ncbi:site-specific integrase [Butyrivibrio sp. CB08]|uniref:tyrosine-type recombinase/integrase n=1 Tax=Butyrivibrio sp. CB08 TaxID=2364879 RepID=UPI000EA99C57|nr:site-specific integrase [Butyrivibrio sp. CB08]MBO4457883.1 site-specific integrase [Butyrivibrio sp.]RKM61128.1 site-specific integrase [Butyrivibrio sp. CB08]
MSKKKKYLCDDGRFQRSFTFNGKRVFVRARDKDELEKKIYEKKLELEEKKEMHDNPTIGIFFERWMENRRGSVTPATLRSQQCHFNTIAKIQINGKAFKDCRLSEVKAEDIRIIQRTLVERKIRTQTVNDKISFISHIFHDAIREQYINYNPCSPVKPLKKTEVAARETIHRALTPEETRLFFEYAQNSFYYDVFRIAIHTGMRIGEIGALKNSDIYNGTIHVNRTITREEDGSYCVGKETKTWSGKRTVPLNESISEIIAHQREFNRMFDGNISGFDDLIFKAPERGLLMATPCDREIKRICKRAGIEHFTCHAFRDTFATRAIEQGIEPRTLQELLGHKDYCITMNLYGHVIDDTKEKAMSRLRIVI